MSEPRVTMLLAAALPGRVRFRAELSDGQVITLDLPPEEVALIAADLIETAAEAASMRGLDGSRPIRPDPPIPPIL